MPINLPREMPVKKNLEDEKIFVMGEERAVAQDIRALNILIVNLMPNKQQTEVQLLRLLGNTPLQINVTFLHMASHHSKTVSKSYLDQFYTTFPHIKERSFDGMIITGAPIESLAFYEVNYWKELTEIMDWSTTHVTSTLHICWGAQAALYYHYGIDKYDLKQKCSGIFEHGLAYPKLKLVRGFDDRFLVPHSRHTTVSQKDIETHPELLLVSNGEAGPFMIISKDEKNIMLTGHMEYDAMTLAEEYERDLKKGLSTQVPENYFPNNDHTCKPIHAWRSHSHLLFSNWLNYYVYQQTPFNWK